ncbi:response regulator transcription factor [Oerskovia sp. M15]
MGFRMILAAEDDIEVVGEASEGETAFAQAAALRPDVILMDVRMPGVNGIDATERIVTELPECRVIILTTFDLDEYAFAALRVGASGFLLRTLGPPSSWARSATSRAVTPRSPRASRAGCSRCSRGTSRRTRRPRGRSGPWCGRPRLRALTARELEVFSALGEGLSNAEIAARFVVSEATVKTHVGRVLGKLDLRDRVQAVVLAYETGVARPG